MLRGVQIAVIALLWLVAMAGFSGAWAQTATDAEVVTRLDGEQVIQVRFAAAGRPVSPCRKARSSKAAGDYQQTLTPLSPPASTNLILSARPTCPSRRVRFEPPSTPYGWRIGRIYPLFVGSQRAVSSDWPWHRPSASHVGRPNGM